MTEKVKRLFISLFAVIFLLIGITATFPHRLFKPSYENKDFVSLSKERAELKVFWNQKEKAHDSLLINNIITKSQYFSVKEINEEKRKSDFRNIAKKRKILALNYSFNGRESFHYWVWIFGIFITLLICSCYLAIKDSRLKKAGLLKWYEPHASVAFILVSLFWMYHTIFKTSKDFELTIYTLYLVSILVPLSYFIYHFLRRGFSIEDKLLENIRTLVSHVLNHTDKNKEDEKWTVLKKVANNGK